MNLDSLSVLMTNANTCGGGQAIDQIRHMAITQKEGNNVRTRSPLVILQGTITARCYADDILTPVYQENNAPPHTVLLSHQCLQGYEVTRSLATFETWTEGKCSHPGNLVK